MAMHGHRHGASPVASIGEENQPVACLLPFLWPTFLMGFLSSLLFSSPVLSSDTSSLALSSPWVDWLAGAAAFFEAAFQGLEEIDDLGLGRFGCGGDLEASCLLLHRAEDPLTVIVMVFLCVEGVGRELLDELVGEIFLDRLEGELPGPIDLVEAAHLVGIENVMQHEAALVRTHEHELLLAARAEPTPRRCASCASSPR